MMAKKPRPFSARKEVRAIARERVGPVKAGKVITPKSARKPNMNPILGDPTKISENFSGLRRYEKYVAYCRWPGSPPLPAKECARRESESEAAAAQTTHPEDSVQVSSDGVRGVGGRTRWRSDGQ